MPSQPRSGAAPTWRRITIGLEVGAVLALIGLGLLIPGPLGRNQRGFHRAPPGGDLGLGPAPAGDLLGAHAAACGEEAAPRRGALVRRPYLQRTTTTGTALLWTAPPGPPLALRLWRADRRDERGLPARLDPVVPPDGAVQWLAQADGLAPATVYCYELHADDGRVFGPVGFRTAPGPDATVRAIALGDMGFRTSDQAAVLAQLLKAPAELVLTTGDNAYPYGRAEELEDHLFAVYAPIMARIPMFPTMGNHDYLTDDGAPLRAAFALPDSGEAGRERWYAFDWGPLRVVVLDSERFGPAQLAWLDDELTRATRPWPLVVVHRPPFSVGVHGNDPEMMVALHPTLVRHRVPLVLCGHDHNYQRTVAVDGVTYVVTGGGGRGTYPVGPGPRTAFAARVAHHLVLEATPTALSVWAVDATGATFDTLRLTAPAQR